MTKTAFAIVILSIIFTFSFSIIPASAFTTDDGRVSPKIIDVDGSGPGNLSVKLQIEALDVVCYDSDRCGWFSENEHTFHISASLLNQGTNNLDAYAGPLIILNTYGDVQYISSQSPFEGTQTHCSGTATPLSCQIFPGIGETYATMKVKPTAEHDSEVRFSFYYRVNHPNDMANFQDGRINVDVPIYHLLNDDGGSENTPPSGHLEITDMIVLETQTGPSTVDLELSTEYSVATAIKNNSNEEIQFFKWVVLGEFEDRVGQFGGGTYTIQSGDEIHDGYSLYIEPFASPGPTTVTMYLIPPEFWEIEFENHPQRHDYVLNNYLAKQSIPVNVVSSVLTCGSGTELVNGRCQAILEPKFELLIFAGSDGDFVYEWGETIRFSLEVAPYYQNSTPTFVIKNPGNNIILSSQFGDNNKSTVEGVGIFYPEVQTGGSLWESPGEYLAEVHWQGNIESMIIFYPGNPELPHEEQLETKIPQHIRTTAGWWADGITPDSDFVNAIKWLMENKIIVIPSSNSVQSEGSQEIPQYIRTTAGWWADGLTPDSDFVNAIQWLIINGIIQIDTGTNGSTEPPTEPPGIIDTDNDGIPDSFDDCPRDPENYDGYRDEDGCPEEPPISDRDNDGIPDSLDNCNDSYNPGQEDADRDGIGDECDPSPYPRPTFDRDGDGITELESVSSDGTVIPGDNCPNIPNPRQEDSDGDGIGDACDTPNSGNDSRDVDSQRMPIYLTDRQLGNYEQPIEWEENEFVMDMIENGCSNLESPLTSNENHSWGVSTGDVITFESARTTLLNIRDHETFHWIIMGFSDDHSAIKILEYYPSEQSYQCTWRYSFDAGDESGLIITKSGIDVPRMVGIYPILQNDEPIFANMVEFILDERFVGPDSHVEKDDDYFKSWKDIDEFIESDTMHQGGTTFYFYEENLWNIEMDKTYGMISHVQVSNHDSVRQQGHDEDIEITSDWIRVIGMDTILIN